MSSINKYKNPIFSFNVEGENKITEFMQNDQFQFNSLLNTNINNDNFDFMPKSDDDSIWHSDNIFNLDNQPTITPENNSVHANESAMTPDITWEDEKVDLEFILGKRSFPGEETMSSVSRNDDNISIYENERENNNLRQDNENVFTNLFSQELGQDTVKFPSKSNLKKVKTSENRDLEIIKNGVNKLSSYIQKKQTGRKLSFMKKSLTKNSEKKETMPKKEELQNDKKYSEEDLKQLFTFLERQLYLTEIEDKDELDNLGSENMMLLSLLLKKLYKENISATELTYEKFKELRASKSTKRNEEKNKIVYKQALNYFEQEFKTLYPSLMIQYRNSFPNVFRHKKSSFYFWLLKKTILTKPEMKDIVMDILHGKSKIKNGQIGRHQNWCSNKNKKPKAITKISLSIKHLIRSDPDCKTKFLRLMRCEDNNDFIESFKKDISHKLNGKENFWLNHLKNINFSFEKFIKFFEEIVDSKQYKSPWTIKSIKEAIEHCINELDNDPKGKLKREFDLIKQRHYSF
jgi:hypothetical protein